MKHLPHSCLSWVTRSTAICYLLLLVVMAVATFWGYANGVDATLNPFYHSVGFMVLWAVTVLGACVLMVWKKVWRKVWFALLHLSFLVILAGAFITHLTRCEGRLALYQGQKAGTFLNTASQRFELLPFIVQLDSFKVRCYPATNVPMDYESYLDFNGEKQVVSMNHIVEKQGFRLIQSSFDESRGLTILQVNYDPYGTFISYVGYCLFVLSMLLLMVSKHSTFRHLLKHATLRCGALVVMGFWGFNAMASTVTPTVPSKMEADAAACTPILYMGRVAPLNTLATDFVRKLSGSTQYNDLMPEQVLLGWAHHPTEWNALPIIRLKNKQLAERLGGCDGCVSFNQVMQVWQTVSNPAQMARYTNAELNEKMALVQMLVQGDLLHPCPLDGSVPCVSPVKLRAEVVYNRVPYVKWLFMLNLTVGFVALLLLLFPLNNGKKDASLLQFSTQTSLLQRVRERGIKHQVAMSFWLHALMVCAVLSCAVQWLGWLWRWYVSGRLPLGNGYETMLTVSLLMLTFALLLSVKVRVVWMFGVLLSGFALLVAHLSEMNPQITPLVPVLMSPWLTSHVLCIMVAYSLYALCAMSSVVALSVRSYSHRLYVMERMLLYPATFLLGTGIFIGAVWANASWGCYWGWDPKEVWALITFMFYGAAFHTGLYKRLNHPSFFHIYMVVGFLLLLITYFGVNGLLGGMHSYAN